MGFKPPSSVGSTGGGVILPFQGSHAYAAGEPMISGGATYTRNSAGTSRASFDTTEQAQWSLLPAGTATITRQNLLNAGSALNEELAFCAGDGRTISATDQSFIATAMFPCAIRAATLIQESGGVGADDTNYWTVDLGRWRAGTWAVIASKTTKTVQSGGEAISSGIPWSYDSITFDATNSVLQKDDVVGVKYTKTGTASSIARMRWTVRYEGV